MWKKIINPETGRKVNINGSIGRIVLNNFLAELQGGSSVCGLDKNTKRCNRKSVGIDGNLCELGTTGRCRKKPKKKKEVTKEDIVKKARNTIKKGHNNGKQVTENILKRAKLTKEGVILALDEKTWDILNRHYDQPLGLRYIEMTDLAEEFIMNGCGSRLLTWAGKVWDFLFWSDDWDDTPEVWRPRLILNWEEHKHNSHTRKLADFPHEELNALGQNICQ
tara:strand:+ start:28 stop:690 length:663 start_codon:yes stop_codon:yes gene_type:complete